MEQSFAPANEKLEKSLFNERVEQTFMSQDIPYKTFRHILYTFSASVEAEIISSLSPEEKLQHPEAPQARLRIARHAAKRVPGSCAGTPSPARDG
jgi:hypothetical protein